MNFSYLYGYIVDFHREKSIKLSHQTKPIKNIYLSYIINLILRFVCDCESHIDQFFKR